MLRRRCHLVLLARSRPEAADLVFELDTLCLPVVGPVLELGLLALELLLAGDQAGGLLLEFLSLSGGPLLELALLLGQLPVLLGQLTADVLQFVLFLS